MVEKAIERNLSYMAVTDHCDVFLCEDDRSLDMCSHLITAAKESDELNRELGEQCYALRGVELGDGIWHPDISQKVTDMLDYDVVVGGTHAVKCLATTDGVGMKHAFSQIKYNELPKELFDDLMKNYFDDIMTMVTTQDIDIMAHIICPLGYPLHRHKIYVDARPYEKKIEAVLKEVIKRGIAFEANPMLFEVIDGEMPYLWIVEKFRDLGGHLFTFSTDAHSPKGVGADFARRVQIMKDLGFRNVFYFKNRRAVPCAL
jgi:histidinol-phosphatase (PHP family)